MFSLMSSYTPQGDQPDAIAGIMQWFTGNEKRITLLGATGTGKTFTMANVIQQIQKPTLILSHNKTLAAQLATEFKYFFPQNAVHYFVSYFDYYQPESYLPEKWVYIEKEATINKEIEMFRLSTMASLLSRQDVIVVSSVSALYGLWSRDFFDKNRIFIEVGHEYDFTKLKHQLLSLQYKPVQGKVEAGMFDTMGEIIDIYPSTEKVAYRLIFNDKKLELIQVKDSLTFQVLQIVDHATIRPATQYMQDMQNVKPLLVAIEAEMEERVKDLEQQGKLAEAQRLKKRVTYDTKMIGETGFVNGIENYSPYFEQRLDGAPPNTLFDYFPEDFLLIVDESHMTLPQLRAMPQGDLSRKTVLIEHGFRLPSAIHHRPIKFEELSYTVGRHGREDHLHVSLKKKLKKEAKTLFVSATPAPFELQLSDKVVQQIIRPTWLLDPVTYVYPKSGSYELLMSSIAKVIKKEPKVDDFLRSYTHRIDGEVFS